MKKRTSLLALAAITALSFALLSGTVAEAGSQCKKCDKAEKCKIAKLKDTAMMLWKHKDALGLTDEQMKDLKKIKHAAIKDMIRLQADVDITKVDINAAMWDAQIDPGKVSKLIDTKYGSKSNIAKRYVQALADMQSVLTDDQRATWLEMRMWKKMSKSCCGKQKGGCDMCEKMGGKCAKCSKKTPDGICPITGKPLVQDKGSMKGSM
ncbi:MAG: Spy/CpxP family protein refolding chaperone [Candidatus Omnitrophica bacterium]|nr:Spy/CpxP family protein refolding chaperone [Candidatus Omnitrophota bacterium]